MNRPRRIQFGGVGVLLLAFATSLAAAQETPPAGPAQDSSSKADKPNKKKYSHLNDFLVRGTVFNEKALSFPEVELRRTRWGVLIPAVAAMAAGACSGDRSASNGPPAAPSTVEKPPPTGAVRSDRKVPPGAVPSCAPRSAGSSPARGTTLSRQPDMAR